MNGRCANSRLSQPRGSPQSSVPIFVPTQCIAALLSIARANLRRPRICSKTNDSAPWWATSVAIAKSLKKSRLQIRNQQVAGSIPAGGSSSPQPKHLNESRLVPVCTRSGVPMPRSFHLALLPAMLAVAQSPRSFEAASKSARDSDTSLVPIERPHAIASASAMMAATIAGAVFIPGCARRAVAGRRA